MIGHSGEKKENVSSSQLIKLKKLLEHASSTVPYYKKLFRQINLDVEKIHSFQDFRRVPFLTKQLVQRYNEELISDAFQGAQLIPRYTSGSTGNPMKVFHTKIERLVSGQHMMRARKKWGLTFPARWCILGGAVHFVSGIEDRVRKYKEGGGEVLRLSSLDLSSSTLDNYIEELEEFQPTWIFSMPSTLDFIAQHALFSERTVNIPSIQLIELAGEYLFPKMRQRIAEAFHYPPTSQYACRELRAIAFECPKNNMHVMHDHVYLEIIKEDTMPAGRGEIGEVVITGLNNYAMPFIRYRLGDLIIPIEKQCSCKDAGPLIQMAGGRITDSIVGQPEKLGNIIFDSIFKYLQQHEDIEIQGFRVIQTKEVFFEVWIVTVGEWSQETKDLFIQKAKHILGENMEFKIVFVSKLPVMPSGKLQSFVVDLKN